MAVKKTKKLSGQQLTTTVASGETFLKVDANGKVTRIDLPHLQSELLGGVNLDCMLDNVFIMYHPKGSSNIALLIEPGKWTALQNAGEIADGVAIIEGGKVLVIAPTESDKAGLLWSSAPVNGGTTMTGGDYQKSLADFNGKANTASIISKSTSSTVTNTSAYAPGFCNLYSRANANGQGLTAGKWWLPSAGEMMMIKANKNKINYCLSLISGATLLTENWYWTSTESAENTAMRIKMSDSQFDGHYKAQSKMQVRPVSAFMR